MNCLYEIAKIADGYHITIEGDIPSKANSYRAGKGLHVNDKVKRYFYLFCLQYRLKYNKVHRHFDGKFVCLIDIYYIDNRKDLDNGFKVIFDCLQTCKVIKNDNRLVKLIANKKVDKMNPRVEIVLIDENEWKKRIKEYLFGAEIANFLTE